MRHELVPQPVPIHDDNDNSNDNHNDSDSAEEVYLAWNGECYQLQTPSSGHTQDVWSQEQSDTTIVANLIRNAVAQSQKVGSCCMLDQLSAVMARLVNAEFALVLLTATAVYYARDSFGRRSLLVNDAECSDTATVNDTISPTTASATRTRTSATTWQLSSVASATGDLVWKEVEPGRVFSYTLQTGETRSSAPWQISLRQLPRTVATSTATSVATDNNVLSMEQASCQLGSLLLQAVRRRLTGPAAILFSGGLDSVVLAALALQLTSNDDDDDTLISLINISFVNDKKSDNNPVSADTQAALASYQDLQRLYPDRHFQFQQIQAEWSEIQAAEEHIQALIHPKTTTMDVNIATALWFAAKAASGRVLLTGLGADEQMGGYGRHRKAWDRGGADQLRQELDLDMGRLWDRNLGRDDRVLSDTSKEARFPFLDPNVVNFLSSQPLDNIVDYSLPPGQGDKRILRLVAERLGLQSASTAVKRAIQFGSRIAHVSDKKRFGSRRKAAGGASLTSTKS
jgi:asparagine synthetase B (glutamine-hydrolysing)